MESNLNSLKKCLEGIGHGPVFYGIVPDQNRIKNILEKWNYIVFSREVDRINNTSATAYYTVAVVAENYIPEGLVEKVINSVEMMAGFKLAANQDIEYDYAKKTGTDSVVEAAYIPVCKTEKRCKRLAYDITDH